MSDPAAIVAGIERAQDAFEYIGDGRPEFEDGIDQDDDWKTQLTKGCRYLESSRILREADGFHGAVIELTFGAIERTLEAYLLWSTEDTLADFHDHEAVYERAAEQGLFERETAAALNELYTDNRTDHYYGAYIPTQQKADAIFDLAERIHDYVRGLLRDGGVCICD